jgi:DNA modification methylase
VAWLVDYFTQPDDLVIDPFCGSGTTGAACIRHGRRFLGIEKSPEFVALARERLTAEANDSTLVDARRGQVALFAGRRRRR